MQAPNFLEGFEWMDRDTQTSCSGVIWLFLLGFGYVLLWILLPSLAFLFTICGVLLFLVFHLEWGVYVMAVLSFMHGWEINFANFIWAREIPFLPMINAPVVDFWVLLVVVAFLLARGLSLVNWREKKLTANFPGFKIYGLFLLVALASCYIQPFLGFQVSFYYWLRAMFFVYGAFVFLPYQIIKTKEVLLGVMKVCFWLGVGAALFGISSLFVGASFSWVRLTPYALGSWAPFGINHNILATVLIGIIPFGFYLFFREKAIKKDKKEYGYGAGTLLMIVVALLTLSRAAWLSLGVEFFVLIWLQRHNVFHWLNIKKEQILSWSVVLLLPFLFYMSVFLFFSPIVTSSTTARLDTTLITLFYFRSEPWLGYGPGSYMELFSENSIYVSDYGEPLDAHGFIQKMLVEDGLVGLALFGFFILWLLYYLYKIAKQNDNDIFPVILLMMVSGLFTFMLFDTSYFNSMLWFPIGLALVGGRLMKKT